MSCPLHQSHAAAALRQCRLCLVGLPPRLLARPDPAPARLPCACTCVVSSPCPHARAFFRPLSRTMFRQPGPPKGCCAGQGHLASRQQLPECRAGVWHEPDNDKRSPAISGHLHSTADCSCSQRRGHTPRGRERDESRARTRARARARARACRGRRQRRRAGDAGQGQPCQGRKGGQGQGGCRTVRCACLFLCCLRTQDRNGAFLQALSNRSAPPPGKSVSAAHHQSPRTKESNQRPRQSQKWPRQQASRIPRPCQRSGAPHL